MLIEFATFDPEELIMRMQDQSWASHDGSRLVLFPGLVQGSLI